MQSRNDEINVCKPVSKKQCKLPAELSDLPDEIICKILSSLKISDLASFMRTSKRGYALSNDITAWNSISARDFQTSLTVVSVPGNAYRVLNENFELEKYKLIEYGALLDLIFLDYKKRMMSIYSKYLDSGRFINEFLIKFNVNDISLLGTGIGHIYPSKLFKISICMVNYYQQIMGVITNDKFKELCIKLNLSLEVCARFGVSRGDFSRSLADFMSGNFRLNYKESSLICYDKMLPDSISPLFENLIDFTDQDLPDNLTQFHYHYELFESIIALHLDIHLRIAIHKYPESLKHLPLLHMACKHGYLFGIQLLLEYGADINRRCWLYEYHSLGSAPLLLSTTPIFQCISYLAMPQILFVQDSEVSLSDYQEDSIDTLQLINRANSCISYLLQHGANVDIADLRHHHDNIVCQEPITSRQVVIKLLANIPTDSDAIASSGVSDLFGEHLEEFVACLQLIKDAPRIDEPAQDAASAAMTM